LGAIGVRSEKKFFEKAEPCADIGECEKTTTNTPILPCSFAVWGQSLPCDGQHCNEFGKQPIE
jgi:hypothetical protein